MTHKALTPSGTHLKPQFNGAASDVCEVEIKFLVPQLPDNKPDKSVFNKIHNHFSSLDWIKTSSQKILHTRQLDTLNRDLLAKGTTIRVRADSKSTDIADTSTPDICVKFGKSEDDNGALRRSEFEARISNFGRVDLHPLFNKYPKDEFPELHAALDGVKESDLRQFFRIVCIRNRHLVDFPEEVTGLKGKRFVGELLLDDVAYVLDVPGWEPLIFSHDLEVEMEAMFKPCDYDSHPDAAKHVSSPMTKEEADRAMAAASAAIQKASGGVLQVNTISKAERGFNELPRALASLRDMLDNNPATPIKRSITPAFVAVKGAANDDQKPHHNLPTDYGYVVRERTGTDPSP